MNLRLLVFIPGLFLSGCDSSTKSQERPSEHLGSWVSGCLPISPSTLPVISYDLPELANESENQAGVNPVRWQVIDYTFYQDSLQKMVTVYYNEGCTELVPPIYFDDQETQPFFENPSLEDSEYVYVSSRSVESGARAHKYRVERRTEDTFGSSGVYVEFWDIDFYVSGEYLYVMPTLSGLPGDFVEKEIEFRKSI